MQYVNSGSSTLYRTGTSVEISSLKWNTPFSAIGLTTSDRKLIPDQARLTRYDVIVETM